MSEKTAALAGATGFLGRRLTLALLTAGWRVRALCRRSADSEALERQGVRVVIGDLSDPEALDRLVVGADAAINCAGLIKARDPAHFLSVNRDGAARMATAGSGRKILISSLAAREPGLSPYAASKKAGEAAAMAADQRLAVLRPPIIYGPGDRETLALFRLAAQAPVMPVPAGETARVAMAHADDVAAAVLDLLDRPDLTGVFAVGGARPEGYTWREIAAVACQAVGRSPPMFAVPAWAARATAILSESLDGFGRAAPIFTQGKVREMLHDDWSVPGDEQVPGAPPAGFSLEAGFADAVAWYREHGWLP